MYITRPCLAASLISTMFLMVAVTTMPSVEQLEQEADAAILTSAIPDAAERSRDLPIILAQVADPSVAINPELLIRLALALSQDGDRAVSGIVHQGNVAHFTAVDAISLTGLSRHAQAVVMAAEAWPRKIGDAWLLTWCTLRPKAMQPTPEAVAALPINLALAGLNLRRSLLADQDPWLGWGSPALTTFLLASLEVLNADHIERYARAKVLRRLYETDAVVGRARILQAIRAGDQTFDATGLLLLPDDSLLELDPVFRQALRGETNWNAICCAARYGSPALLEDIRALYLSKEGAWACDLACGMLKYLVKNDRAAGLDLVRRAMAMRESTGCYRSLLPEVLASFPGDDVHRLLASYVLDPSDDVAREALRAMSMLPGAQASLQAILDQVGASMSGIVREDAQLRLERARGDRFK